MGNYGIGVPKFFQTEIPKVATQSLKTCFIQNKWLELSKDCKSKLALFLFVPTYLNIQALFINLLSKSRKRIKLTLTAFLGH